MGFMKHSLNSCDLSLPGYQGCVLRVPVLSHLSMDMWLSWELGTLPLTVPLLPFGVGPKECSSSSERDSLPSELYLKR